MLAKKRYQTASKWPCYDDEVPEGVEQCLSSVQLQLKDNVFPVLDAY